MKRYPSKLTTPLSLSMVVVFIVIVFLLTLTSCGSEVETSVKTNEPIWNIDEELSNEFWLAVDMLEKNGTNILKLRSEDIEVIFVDELSGDEATGLTVAMAKHRFHDGIKIEVLRDKWIFDKTKEEQDVQILTMLHEIGHDYLNLDHVEGDWDIMNSIGDPNKKISKRQIINSINRMLYEGRKIYDSLAMDHYKKELEKRF